MISGGYVNLTITPQPLYELKARRRVSGLGRATAETIVQHGGHAALLDVNAELGESVVEQLPWGKSAFFRVDVSSSESIAEAVQGCLSWIRETGQELGGIVAAAGVSNPAKMIDRNGDPLDMDGFDFVMNINVRGAIDLVRQMLPYWVKIQPEGQEAERGIIVLVSSSAAFDGQPGQVAYAASKGAIASLTLPLTRDLARYGIRCVTIAPSLFDSGMTALMSDKVRNSLTRVMEFPLRPGQPREFASLVKESIENVMLNGTVLRLDGGMRMPSKM